MKSSEKWGSTKTLWKRNSHHLSTARWLRKVQKAAVWLKEISARSSLQVAWERFSGRLAIRWINLSLWVTCLRVCTCFVASTALCSTRYAPIRASEWTWVWCAAVFSRGTWAWRACWRHLQWAPSTRKRPDWPARTSPSPPAIRTGPVTAATYSS